MAIHDYDLPTEPLYRRQHSSFDDARHAQSDVDKTTIWAGALLGAALLIFIAYMVLVGPAR